MMMRRTLLPPRTKLIRVVIPVVGAALLWFAYSTFSLASVWQSQPPPSTIRQPSPPAPSPVPKTWTPPPPTAPQKHTVSGKCVRGREGRDLTQYPITIAMPGATSRPERWKDCDVPCDMGPPGRQTQGWIDATVDRDGGGHGGAGRALQNGDCPRPRRAVFSMESVAYYPALGHSYAHSHGYDIVATYELSSDVPLPYFSWAEYPFRRPLKWPKSGGAMLAVVISNCGAPSNRLAYIKKLMDYGVTVHSFGACMHNRDMPPKSPTNYGEQKIDLISNYKFTAAMENTLAADYVTEKLFGPLVAGSVPIHMGVKNVHEFAPSHSVISVHDFTNAAELAEYLLYLDRNDTAYREYLAWKESPDFDPRFKALVDISKVHSFCRMCIHVADIDRLEFGPEKRPDTLPTFSAEQTAEGMLPLWVRERGKFWAMPVAVKARSLAELHRAVLDVLRPGLQIAKSSIVWSIYSRYNRSSFVSTDADVIELTPFTELEAIIVD